MCVFYRLTGIIVLSAIMAACSDGTSTAGPEMSVFDIETSVSGGDVNDLGDRLEVTKVIRPEFTEQSMLSYPQIVEVTDSVVYLTDNRSAMSFDLDSGRLLSSFNHRGEGPGEYLSINNAVYFPERDEWGIFDWATKKYLRYDGKGEFLSSRSTGDKISRMQPMSDGEWVAFNGTLPDKMRYMVVTDTAFVPVDTLFAQPAAVDFIMAVPKIIRCNGNVFVEKDDTIMAVDASTRELSAVMALNLGRYAMPQKFTHEEYESLRNTAIDGVSIVFNSSVAFVAYELNGVMHFEVYDRSTSRLLYSCKSDEERGIFGVPVNVDGVEVYSWPIGSYVADDMFYFIVPDFEMSKLSGGSDDDNVNPVILQVRVKSA